MPLLTCNLAYVKVRYSLATLDSGCTLQIALKLKLLKVIINFGLYDFSHQLCTQILSWTIWGHLPHVYHQGVGGPLYPGGYSKLFYKPTFLLVSVLLLWSVMRWQSLNIFQILWHCFRVLWPLPAKYSFFRANYLSNDLLPFSLATKKNNIYDSLSDHNSFISLSVLNARKTKNSFKKGADTSQSASVLLKTHTLMHFWPMNTD